MSFAFNGLDDLYLYNVNNIDRDDSIIDNVANALYLWRRPVQSRSLELYEIDQWSIEWFYRWANEFLNAAMPDGSDPQEWSVEEAAKVYYRMANDGCMYAGLENVRWPQVGHWYEYVAESVMNAALYGIPVDNSKVLPTALR